MVFIALMLLIISEEVLTNNQFTKFTMIVIFGVFL